MDQETVESILVDVWEKFGSMFLICKMQIGSVNCRPNLIWLIAKRDAQIVLDGSNLGAYLDHVHVYEIMLEELLKRD